jgi:hypothetical protein
MTPDEFFSLPVSLQIRRIVEAYPQVAAKAMAGDAPKPMRAPKYDTRIRRKDGFMWASECDKSTLAFWCGRAKSGGDPKYADKNAKEAKALEFFMQYRDWFPSERWVGERNRQQVTADPPSSKPTIRQWEPKGGEAPRGETKFDDGDDGYSGEGGDDYF